MDAIKSRCSRDPCRYFHPPPHLQAQLRASQGRAAAAQQALVGTTTQIHQPPPPPPAFHANNFLTNTTLLTCIITSHLLLYAYAVTSHYVLGFIAIII